MKEQIVFNSDLGLPFSSKGSKIYKADLDLCRRRYQYPVLAKTLKTVRIVGIDVGSVLHVVIREVVSEGGVQVLRLALATHVTTFAELYKLLNQWQPRISVIDALPEIHEVSRAKSRFRNLWSSLFQEGKLEMSRSKKDRVVHMDRTSLFDSVKAGIDEQSLLLPMDAENIDRGEYYSHMQSSTRVLDVNEVHPEKSRYVWRETTADHYFLAEGYCLQGAMMLPKYSVFDYFEKEVQKAIKRGGKEEQIIIKDEEVHADTDNESLNKINRAYKVKPVIKKVVETKIDEEIIQRAVDNATQLLDVAKFEQFSGLRGESAVRVLVKYGYKKAFEGKYKRVKAIREDQNINK